MNHKNDTEGRLILCELENIDDPTKRVTLCNIYGPNKDRPNFFLQMFQLASELASELIFIGDLNVVQDIEADRKGSVYQHHKAHAMLESIQEKALLVDVWRLRNEGERVYSWMRNRPTFIASRLDYALISSGLMDHIEQTMYLPGILSDHTAFYLGIDQMKVERGRGYWKFNASLLRELDFVNAMNKEIESVLHECVNLERIKRWCCIKQSITNTAKKLSKDRAKEKDLIISQLSEHLIQMEYELQSNYQEDRWVLLQKTKSELNDLLTEKTHSIIFRTKANWAEYGERSSKFFLNMEKRRYSARTCGKLLIVNEEVTDPKIILKEQEKYFSSLYSSDQTVKFNIVNDTGIKVNEEVWTEQERPFSKEEISLAHKQLKSGKTPGIDGISPELLKMFWKYLCDPFMCMVEESFKLRKLPDQLTYGIINLLLKAGKDQRFLKNLRPITLLCADYKIIEKAISNRIMLSLDDIISQDQKGFLPGRSIAINIRKILDVMQYCEMHQLDSIILSLDFAKCFDMIENTTIFGSMEYFGFSSYLIDWAKVIYSNFSASVENNGMFTEKFPIQKSVHQGGPASSTIFLLCAEVLAIQLRSNNKIEGITTNSVVNLLNQFADDMDIMMPNKQEVLQECLNILQDFNWQSGFSVNYDKTKVYRIGSLKNSMAKLYTQQHVEWTNEEIVVLGVSIRHDNAELVEQNYQKILAKLQNILATWKNRSLSLFGKICVVNALIASLFVYKMTVLPSMTESMFKNIELQIENFLWNGAKPKVSMSTLKLPKSCGGANLVDLFQKDQSLKVKWRSLIQLDDKFAELVYSMIAPDLGEQLWDCNLDVNDLKYMIDRIDNPFWYDVLSAWFSFCTKTQRNQSSCILWCNSEIRIEGKPFVWKKQLRKGLMYTSDLFDSRGEMIDATILKTKYCLSTMQLNSLISAIPKKYRLIMRIDSDAFMLTTKQIYYELCYDMDVVCKKRDQWSSELGMTIDMEIFQQGFKDVFLVTNIPKYRSFQYRLLHRGLVMNTHLFHWRIRNDNLCSFCLQEKETYSHFFVTCEKVKPIWIQAESFFNTLNEDNIHFDVDTVLWNRVITENASHCKNFMCLVIKQYLYKQRCLRLDPIFQEVKALIYSLINIEKYIAIKNGKLMKHNKKWYGLAEKTGSDAGKETLDDYVNQYIEEM